MVGFKKSKRVLVQNQILYRPVELFFLLISKVYRKHILWVIRGKSSYSTLETCHWKIDTRFEFYSLDLARDRVIWFHLREFEISFVLKYSTYNSTVLFQYFFRARKYRNRIRRKISGGGVGRSEESWKTSSWSKSRKTPLFCRSAKRSHNELNKHFIRLFLEYLMFGS